jgi:hypothetical protein
LARERAPAELVHAAVSWFGTWRKAIAASGLRYDQVTTRLARDEILGRLRELARDEPSMRASDLRRTDHGLVRAAVLHFGSLHRAVARAGLRDWPRGEAGPVDVEQLRQDLLDRVAAGRSIVPTHLAQQARPLYNALRCLGHDTTRTLVHLGLIDPARGRRHWTRARVIEAIQADHRRGLVAGTEIDLFEGAVACFGSFRDATLTALRTEGARRAPRRKARRR